MAPVHLHKPARGTGGDMKVGNRNPNISLSSVQIPQHTKKRGEPRGFVNALIGRKKKK